MENADGMPFPIHQNYGKTIGSLHGKQQLRSIGDQAVAGQRLCRAVCRQDESDRNESAASETRGQSCFAIGDAEFFEKKFSIALDGDARILFRESEIQRSAAIDARNAASSRGKSMDEPRQLTQLLRTQKL